MVENVEDTQNKLAEEMKKRFDLIATATPSNNKIPKNSLMAGITSSIASKITYKNTPNNELDRATNQPESLQNIDLN